MKVITNKKHEDTIDLKDVDLSKHYVVGKDSMNDCFIFLRDCAGDKDCFRAVCLTSADYSAVFDYKRSSLSKLFTRINEEYPLELHAFNTLHEMLDFVKENTDG